MNYSTSYAELQRQFHIDRPDYGMSGLKYTEHILQLSNKLKTRDILDYGCGKATLQKSLPFPIQNYDPFIDEYKQRPAPAQIVVCTDVMEHIEPEYVMNVLSDIRLLTLQLAFFQIATRPAAKFLPDGRNAHLIQEPINWWLRNLIQHFNIHHLEDLGGGFICVCSPVVQPE
jgi:hypothetical protein